MGGTITNGECRTEEGQLCKRDGYWADYCRLPLSSQEFAVCDKAQREAALNLARNLHGGAPTKTTPCQLYPYLRDRTLWLIGDSHTKQLFKALQCFLLDVWDQRECKVTNDDSIVRQLDELPLLPGQSKCIHLAGNGRICRITSVLGTSLTDNPKIADGGLLNLLRDKNLASPQDVFIFQFGIWHMKSADGASTYREALHNLGKFYQAHKEAWPHLMFRETPMSHEMDVAHKTCRPAPAGIGLDYSSGRLLVRPSARSASAGLLARGGALNSPARDILGAFGMPILGGWSYSVALHGAHVEMRGSPNLDCVHYCSPGMPELTIYELTRSLEGGIAEVRALPEVPASRRRQCFDAPSQS